jgi:hypothetical protein
LEGEHGDVVARAPAGAVDGAALEVREQRVEVV